MDQQMQSMSDQDSAQAIGTDDSFGDSGATDWKSQDDDWWVALQRIETL